MSKGGSDREPQSLPVALSPVVVVLGVLTMGSLLALWGRVGSLAALGLRPALVVAELGLVTPGLLALYFFRVPLRTGLGLRPLGGRTLALSLLAGCGLWAASLGIFELQFWFWQPPDGYFEAFRRLHAALRPSGPADALLSVAAIAVVPAICEELLFRGIVLPSFAARFGSPAAVVVSALLFGLIHLDMTSGSFYRVPFASAVGVGMGAIRVGAGSVMAPAVAHALLNTITFVAVPLTDDASELPDPHPGRGALLLLAGGAVSIAAIRALRQPRN